MVSGLFTSFLMELLVYPVIFYLWRVQQIKTASGTGITLPITEKGESLQ